MKQRMISLSFVALLLTCPAIQPLVWAGVATEQMRDTVDRVVAVIQDPRLKAAGGQAERR